MNGEALMPRSADVVVRALARNPRIVTRFWSRVEKGASDDGCWNWRGASSAGYALFYVGQRSIAPAKIAWFTATGEMPSAGRMVHVCENPHCVRPDHLAWGLSHHAEQRLTKFSGSYVTNRAMVALRGDEQTPRAPRVLRLLDPRAEPTERVPDDA